MMDMTIMKFPRELTFAAADQVAKSVGNSFD